MQLLDLFQEARVERLGEARCVPASVRQRRSRRLPVRTRQGHHRFCKYCGVTVFGEGDVKELGGAFVSISVAAIDDLSPEELERLPIRHSDGLHNNRMNPPKHHGYL